MQRSFQRQADEDPRKERMNKRSYFGLITHLNEKLHFTSWSVPERIMALVHGSFIDVKHKEF